MSLSDSKEFEFRAQYSLRLKTIIHTGDLHMTDMKNTWQVVCSESNVVIAETSTYGSAVRRCNDYNANRGLFQAYVYVRAAEDGEDGE